MQVHVGHVFFPSVTPSPHGNDNDDGNGESSAKRFRHESCKAELKSSFNIVPRWLSTALQQALQKQHGVHHDAQTVEVRMDGAGRGASFCFVPGVLSESLRTPTHIPIELSSDVSITAVEAVTPSPLFTELGVFTPNGEVWCCLPVYWEKRMVMATSARAARTAATADDRLPSHGSAEATSAAETLLEKRLLVVGAGGIGCELLKVLVLYGFCNIDVVDLDSIDATNLNRQFLFQKEDVGASKAETARKSILSWFRPPSSRPAPTINAHHANIKSDAYDEAFFRQFSLVLNALDNVAARQHVNRMCMRVDVPLIESGTMGYNGQVQPIVRGLYECYDCRPKAATQPTVAVCTIHARPTTMVHCVHYAKELYERLFGDKRPEEGDELAFVDAALAAPSPLDGQEGNRDNDICDVFRTALALARSLFHDSIQSLLAMKSVWTIQPPVPILGEVLDHLSEQLKTASASSLANRARDAAMGELVNVSRDKVLSVEETLMLFVDAFARCTRRGTRSSFQKEDDDVVDFVATVANLRATIFHIVPPRSVEEIRSIAGSIVPAIATTNAIVAAAVVQQALCVLKMKNLTSPFLEPKTVFVRRAPQVRRRRISCDSSNTRGGSQRWVKDLYLVHSAPPSPPSSACIVCRDCRPTVRVYLDSTCTTLQWFVCHVLRERLTMAAPSIFCGANVIYEEGEYEAMAATLLVDLMGVGVKPLELLVDDLDREVEWRLVVEHSAEQQNGDVVVIDGLESALQLESLLVSGATASASATNPNATAVSHGNDVTVFAEEVTGVEENDTAPVVVLVDDEESLNSDAVDVVEID